LNPSTHAYLDWPQFNVELHPPVGDLLDMQPGTAGKRKETVKTFQPRCAASTPLPQTTS